MKLRLLAVLFFGFVTSAKCDIIYISDYDYQILPPIFHIDPYDQCREEKKLFCRTTIKLTPLDPTQPSKVWKLIEETKKSKEYYAHDELYHAICLDGKYSLDLDNDNSTTILEKDISTLYTSRYENDDLEATVVDINCEHFKYTPRFFDFMLLFVAAFYVSLTIIATLYHIRGKGTRRKALLFFSLRHNFNIFYQKADFGKIKCVQGIRFYLLVLIITGHTWCSFTSGYIADTKYIEDLHRNILKLVMRILYLFWTQPYFLISAWLLSYHTFKTLEKPNQVGFWKYTIQKICNRYVRLVPLVAFAVCLNTTVWAHALIDTPSAVIANQEYQRCQKNWWVSLLFFSNHYQRNDMCVISFWYLSADFQLYVFSVICLVLILKFDLPKILTLSVCTMVGISINSFIFYMHSFGPVYDLVPNNTKINGFFGSEFLTYHASTYSNMPTYMLGLISGYIYYRLENHTVFDKKVKVLVWWVSCIGIPLAVTTISMYQYSRLTSAILAALLKPLFGLASGIAIFGIAKGLGGVLKVACEWKPVLYLGSLGYSTYAIHLPIVLFRTVTTPVPLHITDLVMLVSFFQDVLLSLICGFAVHLLIELPILQLQVTFRSSERKSGLKNEKDS